MRYFFMLKNESGSLLALSKIFDEDDNLNQNLARWISYGFPGCDGEDNGAGIIVPGDQIFVEHVVEPKETSALLSC